jgi:cytochrome b
MKENEIVWDLPTRILHWLIALPVLMNFFIEGGDLLHNILGYIALAAVFLRLLWGMKTRSHGRVSSFPLRWSELKEHALTIFQTNSKKYVGHNPMASWTYILIWTLVILLGVTGFMLGLDAFWGLDWVEKTHETFSVALQVLVLFHFIGLIVDSIKFKRKTWLGMITGRKNY